MDLIKLHNLMKSKKFHYFTGQTNDKDSKLYLEFSTLAQGKGNSIEFIIGKNDTDVKCWILSKPNIEKRKLKDDEVFEFIKTLD